ncbi:MAG: threonine synthase [Clostridia bacterium]|nr:threonine synthase [Clostridia bacterium]
MAEFTSTRNILEAADAHRAVVNGLAPDGGLYVPASIPSLPISDVLSLSYTETAKRVLSLMLPSFSYEDIAKSAEEAYLYHFETEQVAPLVKNADAYALELFHGETCAFKDVALSILPRLLTRAKKAIGMTDDILILTATSGDTGSAAMNGFKDVNGTGIIVFYPKDGVSEIQQRQMTAMTGNNLTACAVYGNFDDCQSAVKRMFKSLMPPDGIRLSSANSINIARLAPQITYYYTAYKTLVNDYHMELGKEVDFIVPTGNFGDILAGYYAKKMGLPVGKLICASNANRVLTDFIATGVYDRRRDFHKTISPSMDILISSNLERLLFHAENGDCEIVKRHMEKLSETGMYKVSESALINIQSEFMGYTFTDEDTKDEIKKVFSETGYLIDPHTAVGFRAKDQYLSQNPGRCAVVLSTASPFKFASSVMSALSLNTDGDAFEKIARLSDFAHTAPPKAIDKLRNAKILHTDETSIEKMPEYVYGKAAKLCRA